MQDCIYMPQCKRMIRILIVTYSSILRSRVWTAKQKKMCSFSNTDQSSFSKPHFPLNWVKELRMTCVCEREMTDLSHNLCKARIWAILHVNKEGAWGPIQCAHWFCFHFMHVLQTPQYWWVCEVTCSGSSLFKRKDNFCDFFPLLK